VTIRPVSLLAIALSLAAVPLTQAQAGWRDAPFYGDGGGWGGEFEAPMRPYHPRPIYREDDGGYETRSFYPRPAYPRPWVRSPAYEPDIDGSYDVLPEERGPAMRRLRPPRNVVGTPQSLPRPALPKPRSATLSAPKKMDPAKVLPPATAPTPRPEPVQEARALPVPRPNLESMDFEPSK